MDEIHEKLRDLTAGGREDARNDTCRGFGSLGPTNSGARSDAVLY